MHNPVPLPASSRSLMPPPAGYPPSLPPRQHCTGPNIYAPAAWSADSCIPTNPVSLPGSSRSIMPPPAGYSKHHASYSNSLNYWSHLARTPGASLAETIILNILVLHEGGQRHGRLHGTPFGNIVEGKKGIDAQITAPGLVAVARQTLDPHIIAFCPDFPWRPDEFISQWVEYQQFIAKWDGVTAKPTVVTVKSKLHPGPSGQRSRPSSLLGPSGRHSGPSSSFLPSPNDSSSDSSPILSSTLALAGNKVTTSHEHSPKLSTHGDLVSGEKLFLDEEDGNRKVLPKSINKSSITTKSPPAKKSLTKEHLDLKSLCEALLTKKPLDPDSLREALKVGGTADLDISKVLKSSIYSVDFYPIPTVPISLILKNTTHRAFNVDPKTATMHPGQLRLSSEDSFIGAGGFKTAYTATLLLSKLTQTGIGSQPCENIVVKRPYIHQGKICGSPWRRLAVREESEKLFREANVLYWAKSLFQVVEDFIATALANAVVAPPFDIPSGC
ncbi:hypothetical protein J3R83DRAFT_8590 [Lanmaoa asiatica]|nr:hypothetical protein J3R83DRAFT_8590 [Lanmaoa asiatica]